MAAPTAASHEIHYVPDGRTLEAYMASGQKVVCIEGPVGSGKSSATIARKFACAIQQPPGQSGVRRRRTAIIRDTLPDLRISAMKTFHSELWFPPERFGTPSESRPPPTSIIDLALPDGSRLLWEVIWLGLNRIEDVRKVLSTDLSDAWINEAKTTAKAIVDALSDRIGRFPSEADGGCFSPQIHCDTNAAPAYHWMPIMGGWCEPPDWMDAQQRALLLKPDNWEFFSQPPALVEQKAVDGTVSYRLNPARENQKFLRDDYYDWRGKSKDYIDVMYMVKHRELREGKAVFEWFDRDVHVASAPIEIDLNYPLYWGNDPSLNTGTVFGQDIDGQVRVLAEFFRTDMGAERYLPALLRWIGQRWPNLSLSRMPGMQDPHGDSRSELRDSDTVLRMYQAAGLEVQRAPTNDLLVRLGMVDRAGESFVQGRPGLIIDPSCSMLIEGFEGAYKYKALKGPASFEMGGHEDEPLKNLHSNLQDALQYMLMRMGRHHEIQGRERRAAGARGAYQVPRTWQPPWLRSRVPGSMRRM